MVFLCSVLHDQCYVVQIQAAICFLLSRQDIRMNFTENFTHAVRSRSVPEPPQYILLIAVVFYSLIFVVGITGNAFIVGIVCGLRCMRTRMGYMFMNLAMTDILILMVCMPSAAIDLFAKEVWFFGEFACEYYFILNKCAVAWDNLQLGLTS